MRRVLAALTVATVSSLALWACATGGLIDPNIDTPETGVPDTSTKGDSSIAVDAGCPQYNTNTDPKHCGSCTNACTDLQVCSSGVCKAACDPPTVKCSSDAGSGCFDTTKDPNHCGGCTNVCTVGDSGALTPGNNNPDSGIPIPDGGYDGGIGWANGTATCGDGGCGVNCPPNTTVCSDNICYDTQNFHDHCGDCNTACAANTEWCTQGHCCSVGQAYCNGACTDVLADNSNCGACGNKCGGNTPNCSNGICKAGYVYTDNFVNNVTPTTRTGKRGLQV
jgi:hypothetical protein